MAEKTKAVLDAAEKALDAIEDKLDVIEDTAHHVDPRSFNLNGTSKGQQVAIVVVAFGAGVVIGSAVTYKLVEKKLKSKYEAILDEEILKAKSFYKVIHKQDELGDPLTALEDYAERIRNAGYTVSAPAASEEELAEHGEEAAEQLEEVADEIREISSEQVTNAPTTRNIFQQQGQDAKAGLPFDPAVEKSKSDGGKYPYIIEAEEYFANEFEWPQSTLTYYEKDGVLADERELPVEPDSDVLVGDENLLHFGKGSRDPNTVYIRNERIEREFEVLRRHGSYKEEVAGFDDEDENSLSHSAMRRGHRVSRFRPGDDE